MFNPSSAKNDDSFPSIRLNGTLSDAASWQIYRYKYDWSKCENACGYQTGSNYHQIAVNPFHLDNSKQNKNRKSIDGDKCVNYKKVDKQFKHDPNLKKNNCTNSNLKNGQEGKFKQPEVQPEVQTNIVIKTTSGAT